MVRSDRKILHININMKNIKQAIILLACSLLLTATGVTLFRIFFTDLNIFSKEKSQSGSSAPLIQSVLEFDLFGYTDRGDKKWQIHGKKAEACGDVVKVKSIIAKTFDDKKINLSADEGYYNRSKKNVVLQNHVVVTTDDGVELKTDRLIWFNDRNILQTDKRIVVTRENVKTVSKGAVAFPQSKKINLLGSVKITQDNKDNKITISCDGPLNIDYAANIAKLHDNVIIVDAEKTIYSDYMEVYFDTETKDIVKAIAKQNVKITKDKNITTCEEATYYAKEGRIVLTGKPKIVFYTDEDTNAFIGNEGTR